MKENKKSYYAIIPATVRYDENLCANAKLLYGELTALCNEKGYCWATNNYFAELYKVSKQTVSKWIKNLKDSGYINYTIEYKQGSKEIAHRYIRIIGEGIQENVNTPINEKFKDNTTYINNTSNNTINTRKQVSEDSISPIYKSLSDRLASRMEANDPKIFKAKNGDIFTPFRLQKVTSWCDDIRKLVEIDGRAVEEVEKVIDWCQDDPFWKSNILSGRKLREKFPTLLLQMNKPKAETWEEKQDKEYEKRLREALSHVH